MSHLKNDLQVVIFFFSFVESVDQRLDFIDQRVLMFRKNIITDEALLKSISAGGRSEARALEYIINKEYPKIMHFVLQHSGNDADAEDVFQEALTALVLNIRRSQYKGESALGTYLFAIAKGVWFKRIRKVGRDRDRDQEAGHSSETVDLSTPETPMIAADKRQTLLEVFESLGEKCPDVLFLWASGYNMEEIALRAGYSSAQAAMNRKNKCLKALHAQMDDNPILVDLLKNLR